MRKSILIPALTAVVIAAGVAPTLTAHAAGHSPGWQRVAVKAPSKVGNTDLSAAFVAGPSDAWVAGAHNVPGESGNLAVIEHWNGHTFAPVRTPRVRGADQTYLLALHGTGPTDVWGVGFRDRGAQLPQSLIEHWDGTRWTQSPSPPDEPAGAVLECVSADAPDDVWAVGHSNPGGGVLNQQLVEHFNGTRWHVVPGLDEATALLTVDAIADDDVWTVGIFDDNTPPVIEHFDGSTWTLVEQPLRAHDTVLHGLSDLGPNDLWAVGETNGDTLTEHWDGRAWTVVPSPNGASPSALGSVAATSKNDIWAVGVAGVAGEQSLAEHWNGRRWAITATPTPGISNQLDAVSSVPDGPVIAAGSLVTGSRPYPRRPLALQH